MTRARFVGAALLFAAATAAAVIAIGDHDATVQAIALIVVPTLLPFLVVAPTRWVGERAWLWCAALPALGWASTIRADVRHAGQPDASFAVLHGWAACALATLLAGVWIALRGIFVRRR